MYDLAALRYDLRVDCNPVPWKAHGGYGKRSFNPRHHEKIYYQHHWKQQYQTNDPLTCAVSSHYIFAFPIPHSWSEKKRLAAVAGEIRHVTRPDTSNLVKFCEDTLKGIVIDDDCQVIELTAQKIYASLPFTLVKIIPYML